VRCGTADRWHTGRDAGIPLVPRLPLQWQGDTVGGRAAAGVEARPGGVQLACMAELATATRAVKSVEQLEKGRRVACTRSVRRGVH
jgi:hypothetical protein